MANLLEVFEKEPSKEYEESTDVLLIHGDALTNLRRIKKESIDLIFADPPYNLDEKFKKDFGKGTANWSQKNEYINWCKTWIDECFKVLKATGTFYFMSATQHMPYLDEYVQTNYHVLRRIIWAYDSSGKQAKKIFGSLYEPILMCTKSPKSQYVFNSEDIRVEAKTGAKRKLIDYRKDPPQPYNSEKVPGNVWYFPRVRYRMPEYEKHPSQKPEALLERIVLASSNPRDIILDPFAGTCTTCAVAMKNNRKAIGIEIESSYYKIGLRRTDDEKQGTRKLSF